MGIPASLTSVMSITTNRQSEPLEQRSASAFALAGVLILASLVVPVGLEPLTDWSWAAGLVLIGLAVTTISVGLIGLYPRVNDRVPGVALAGVGAAAVAGVAALGLIALVGFALVGEVVLGTTVSEPMGVFAVLSLSMAGGFSLGLLLFGVASWRTGTPSMTVGALLFAGGIALLAPVVIELIGLRFGMDTPAWLLFPVIGAIALDALAIGYSLRSRTDPHE